LSDQKKQLLTKTAKTCDLQEYESETMECESGEEMVTTSEEDDDEESSEIERVVEGLGRYWLLIWAFLKEADSSEEEVAESGSDGDEEEGGEETEEGTEEEEEGESIKKS